MICSLQINFLQPGFEKPNFSKVDPEWTVESIQLVYGKLLLGRIPKVDGTLSPVYHCARWSISKELMLIGNYFLLNITSLGNHLIPPRMYVRIYCFESSLIWISRGYFCMSMCLCAVLGVSVFFYFFWQPPCYRYHCKTCFHTPLSTATFFREIVKPLVGILSKF